MAITFSRGTGGRYRGSFFRMNVIGLQELQRTLERLHREGVGLNEEMEQAVHEGLDLVKDYSNEIAPIATGYMRSTAYVSVTRARNGKLKGIVGYTAPYARWVHENPDAKHAEGTRWKFLEEAFAELRPKLGDIIKKATAKAITDAVNRAQR